MARANTTAALQTLVEVMKNPKTSAAARVAAANSLLDRGYGRPESFAHIKTESTRMDLTVLSIEERAELDRLCTQFGLIAAKPGFLLEDDGNGSGNVA